MDNGYGMLGHCAQQHAEWELRHEMQVLVMGLFMQGCPVSEMEWRFKVARVSLIWFNILVVWIMILIFSNLPKLSVEGAWTGWGSWDTCSATCGEGMRSRTRNFTGGIPCTGNATDTETCQRELMGHSFVLWLLRLVIKKIWSYSFI